MKIKTRRTEAIFIRLFNTEKEKLEKDYKEWLITQDKVYTITHYIRVKLGILK